MTTTVSSYDGGPNGLGIGPNLVHVAKLNLRIYITSNHLTTRILLASLICYESLSFTTAPEGGESRSY
jgi:hypothetical protein